jgi:hypothetical protein
MARQDLLNVLQFDQFAGEKDDQMKFAEMTLKSFDTNQIRTTNYPNSIKTMDHDDKPKTNSSEKLIVLVTGMILFVILNLILWKYDFYKKEKMICFILNISLAFLIALCVYI